MMGTLLLTTVFLATSAALVVGFAGAARWLLGMRAGIVRTLVAGGAGLLMAAVSAAFIQRPEQHRVFTTLQVGLSLLLAMGFLVLAEISIPSGSWVRGFGWLRALRRRTARVRRYSVIAGIAARYGLGQYLRGRHSSVEHVRGTRGLARSLRLALEEGGIIFIKFGQLLSTRPDLLPQPFVDELSRLQNRAQPIPWSDVETVLCEELGRPPVKVFAEIDRTPLAAASTAQVHRARLHGGEHVVLKVQRPGVREAADRDLEILLGMAKALEIRTRWGASMRTGALAKGFAVALREELDLRGEARNITTVAGAIRKARTGVTVPAVYDELSTERLLVAEYLPGTPVSDLVPGAEPERVDRLDCARRLLACVLRQMVVDGVFHADPHPGNVLVLPDGRIGLVDFASVGRLDVVVQRGLRQLFLALDQNDPGAMCDALLQLVAWPVDVREKDLERGVAHLMVRYATPGVLNGFQLYSELFQLLLEHRLSVPPEVATVFRALATLEGTLTKLDPGFELVAEARRLANDFLGAQFNPTSVPRLVTDELRSLLPLLRQLPRRVNRISNALEHGRLVLNVRVIADDSDRRFVVGLLHQVLLVSLTAITGFMGVLLCDTTLGPRVTPTTTLMQLVGYHLLLISALFMLRVLFAIYRTSR